MTLQERLAHIDQHIARKEEAARAKLEQVRSRAEQLYDDMMKFGSRVGEVLQVGDYLVSKQVEFPKAYEVAGFGYGTGSYDFMADGFYHALGFSCEREAGRKEYTGTALAIYAGGACGPWDFFFDGDEAWLRHNRTHEYNLDHVAMMTDMERFLSEFPVFESAFYKWVDSLKV